MNQRWADDLLDAIATFESDPSSSIEVVQAKLQSALTLWEGSTVGPEYDAIDLAENALENVLHTRLLAEQRDAALEPLRLLRAELAASQERSC